MTGGDSQRARADSGATSAATKLRRGEKLVTVGSYEGRKQRVHIARRRDTRYSAYETLCGFFATYIGGLGSWMKPTEATEPKCKRCLTKATKR